MRLADHLLIGGWLYTAANAEAARIELDTFANFGWGKKYPCVFANRTTPGNVSSPAPSVYTTNGIESLNYQLPDRSRAS
jgi:transposase-like protein